MVSAVVLGIVGGATTLAVIYLGWRLHKVMGEAVLWRETAKRQVTDLVTASENNRSLEAALNVLRAELKAQSDYMAALAAAHPELVGDYVREQLRKAGRLTADPRGPSALPAEPAPGVPSGGTGGRNP